jgi:hypothetical protein
VALREWRPLQPLIEVGVIDPLYVGDKTPKGDTRKMLEILRKLSAGYWPKAGEYDRATGMWTGQVDWPSTGADERL